MIPKDRPRLVVSVPTPVVPEARYVEVEVEDHIFAMPDGTVTYTVRQGDTVKRDMVENTLTFTLKKGVEKHIVHVANVYRSAIVKRTIKEVEAPYVPPDATAHS